VKAYNIHQMKAFCRFLFAVYAPELWMLRVTRCGEFT